MKKPSPAVVTGLQSTCQTLAHLAGQYQVDVITLKCMGLGWLACKYKDWYSGSEDFLRKFIKRLLKYDIDPSYDAGSVTGLSTISDILKRSLSLTTAALDAFKAARITAWNNPGGPDYTVDLYEHVVGEMETQVVAIEKEIFLIGKLGEPGYIGARLEDE